MRDNDYTSLRREFLGVGLTGTMIGLAGCTENINLDTFSENNDEDPVPDIDTAGFRFDYDYERQAVTIEFTGGANIKAGNLQIQHEGGREVRWAELGSTTAGPDEDIKIGATAVLSSEVLNWETPIQSDGLIRVIYVGKETPATLDRYSPPEPTVIETTVPNSSDEETSDEETSDKETSDEETRSESSNLGWKTKTEGDANINIITEESLGLRVFKCSTAVATKQLGETSGEIEISFDYELETDQWFEQGMFVVIEDGKEKYRSFENGQDTLINHTRGKTETGSVNETISVDGDVSIDFRIEPSPYCDAGDHGNTYLRVENVKINRISKKNDATPPSISAFSIADTGDQQIRISFDSSNQLSLIEVTISGAESATLTTSDFSEADSNSTLITYEATYQAISGGTYTASLDQAVDRNGNTAGISKSVSVTTESSADSEIEIDGWETDTEGDANIDVVNTEAINLQVFKCGNAAASTNIGEIGGELEISFDYELEADQWFEQGMFVVIEDGEEVYRSFKNGQDTLINHTRGKTENGSVNEAVSVNGDVNIDFRIEPSPYCDAGDHGNTYLRVENIRFTANPI